MPSDSKPTPTSEPRYPKLSESEKQIVLREVKKLQDAGLMQYKSQGYPSLGPEPDENQ